MYQTFKRAIKSVLPHRLLIKVEPLLRQLIYPFYKGTNYQCSCCNANLKKFIPLKSDLLCPKCGSIGRDRRIIHLLEKEFNISNNKLSILDFSPSRSVYRYMKKNGINGYIGTDLSGDFIADKAYDITNIECPDHQFDVVICYHVLEHVPNDFQAMRELKRILKPGGICFIQTPFHEGEIYEDATITSAEDRLIHFGQEDHVRIYSVDGLKQRLISVGFNVDIQNFHNPLGKEGLIPGEIILRCT